MNRKAAGIILSIASVALIAGIFCRPSFQAKSPERHAMRPPATFVASSPEPIQLPSETALRTQADSVQQSDRLKGSTPVVQATTPDPSRNEVLSYPGDRADQAKVIARYGDAPLTADHKDMKAAIEIQERNNRWLMANPAVVGTAVGLNDDAQIALIVYTKVDAPEIPKLVEGLPVVVWKSGQFFARNRLPAQEAAAANDEASARAKPSGGGSGGTTFKTTDRFPRPVPIGVSTGHPDITAGTIGCRVKKNGQVFALSNNHVYANVNAASVGDNVLQPGTYDFGVDPADAIGTLFEFTPISFSSGSTNTIDAAIALSSTANLGKATPGGGYGTPRSSTVSAAVGLRVSKFGRTTTLTQGRVYAVNATVSIQYDDLGLLVAQFVNQIVITPGTFSAGGDSGSLIVTKDTWKPVGLLFAGSQFDTIANPIDPVLSAFGVTIDGN